jgi:hypothetical protein
MRLSKIFILLTTMLFFVVSVDAAMAQGTTDPPKACWKKSYGRGAGTIPPNCSPGMDKDAGLCYQKCAAGFKGVGPVCWQSCPADYKDDGATCRKDVSIIKKDSYGRGVGKVGTIDGGEKQAGLWYKACNAGYQGKGPVCWKVCPAGYTDDGATCRKDAHVFGKESKGRGVGITPKVCDAGKLYDKGGLCYKACNAGYYGVGPVCWQSCTSSVKTKEGTAAPTDCGAACSSDKAVCQKFVGDWIAAGLGVLAGAMGEDSQMVADSAAKVPQISNCTP